MSRIQLEDDFLTMFTKMCDGNPGALTTLLALFKDTPAIDPQSALGGLGPILMLDDMGIYGSHIWILFKYICKQDICSLVALIRAHQLGFVSTEELKMAINSEETRGTWKLDVAALVAKVEEELTEFQKAPAPVTVQ
jgi:hypothetical protein